MKVLVAGGAGYVGSTICSALIDAGMTPIILDALITGRDKFVQDKLFYHGDISDKNLVRRIFKEHPDIVCAIDCAEKAAVEQSVRDPYEFYSANVFKAMELFKLLIELGCKKIIFSSTGSLYDDIPGYMVTESAPINPRSPFARSKYMTEMILKDFCTAYGLQCISLRYFNPIGADPKLRSGVQPKNPVNIVGKLMQVTNGEESTFKIAGKDWGTRDGTCIRDYVHVWDVATAYAQAVSHFDSAFAAAFSEHNGFLPINIGSGVGVTVKEFVLAFRNVTGKDIITNFCDRRSGDIAGSYANITRAKNLIFWEAKRHVEEAIQDALSWEAFRQA